MKENSPWRALISVWVSAISAICAHVIGSHLVRCSYSSCFKDANRIPYWVNDCVFWALAFVAMVFLFVHLTRLKQWQTRILSFILNVAGGFGLFAAWILLTLMLGHWHK